MFSDVHVCVFSDVHVCVFSDVHVFHNSVTHTYLKKGLKAQASEKLTYFWLQNKNTLEKADSCKLVLIIASCPP